MGSISITFQASAIVGPNDEPDRFVTEYRGLIHYIRDDDGTSFRVGRFTAIRINVGLGMNHGATAWEICDAHSQYLTDVFGLVFSRKSDDFKNSIYEEFEPGDNDVLVLEFIALHPKLRGRGLGLTIARTIIDQLSAGCGLTIAHMAPIPPGDAEEYDLPRKWLPGATDFCTPNDAQRKLASHFAKMGFQRIGKSDWYGLSMTRRLPTVEDLERMRRRK